MSDNIKIVFMGTPEFAVPTLKALHKEFGVGLVVTTPDKQQGRGLKLIPSDVKKTALELAIPILQPEKLKDPDFVSKLKEYNPDIIVVLAFRILPKEVFTLARLGTFNIHASLLPKYRGAAPINWAIINGEKTTGLTAFLINEKVDTGNILLQKAIDIPENFTAGDLHDLLMYEAPEIAISTCKLLISGNYTAYKQDDSQATPAPKIFPEFCQINWTMDADYLKRFIHGVSPIPGAYTFLEGKRLKIYRVEHSCCGTGQPGYYEIQGKNLIVQCGKGFLSLLEVQPEGKKIMRIEEFINGFRGPKKGFFSLPNN